MSQIENITSLQQLHDSSLQAHFHPTVPTNVNIHNPCSDWGCYPVGWVRGFALAAGMPLASVLPSDMSDTQVATFWDAPSGYTNYISPNDENFWVLREAMRFARNVYLAPAFASRIAAYHSKLWWHFPHVSVEDPSMVAYTPSHDYGKRDRQVRLKAGRYLTKFYSDVLGEAEIRQLVSMCKPYEVKFAETAEEMVHVYQYGPNSCMSGPPGEFYRGRHPVEAYANGLFRLAYFGDGTQITARGYVYEPDKVWVRMYGDHGPVLGDMLNSMGYNFVHAWSPGTKLRLITHTCGQPMLPYLDGNEKGVYIRGSSLVVTDDRDCAEWWANGTGGTGERVEQEEEREHCHYCDEYYDEDDMRTVGLHEDDYICIHCRDNHYTHAVVDSHRGHFRWRYLPNDDVISVGDEYYLCDYDLLERLGFSECPLSGDWITADDSVRPDEESSYSDTPVDSDYIWMPCMRGDGGTGDTVVLTVEDVSLSDLVLMHPNGSYNLYPEWCVRDDEQMMESWAENPDMFITLRVALASRLIEVFGEQRMLTADNSVHLRNWYPMSSKMARLAQHAGVEDPYTPRAVDHTSYHMGAVEEYEIKAIDAQMAEAMRRAGAAAQHAGDVARMTLSQVQVMAREYATLRPETI